MKINIKGDFSYNQSFCVDFNEKTVVLDEFNKNAIFQLDESQNCKIKIYQKPSFNNHSFLMILLFVLTSILQGLFNIIFMNTNSNWYRNINPYCVTLEFEEFISSDKELVFKYKSSEFNKYNLKFTKPEVTCSGFTLLKTTYNDNIIDFSNQYFNYVKKVMSVGLICELIFLILLIISLNNAIYIASIVCSVLGLIIILLQILMLLKEYKFYKKILLANKVL